MTFSAVFAFLKTKAGRYLIAVIIGLVVFAGFMIAFSVNKNILRQRQEKIERQKEEIIRLELQNETLQKELKYIKENEKRIESFNYSKEIIDNFNKVMKEDELKLTGIENETFNILSNDFYNYFNYDSLMRADDKIYEDSSFRSSRYFLYKTNRKQKRSMAKLQREFNKDSAVAAMV